MFLVRLDSSNAVAASITDYENQWIWVVKSTKAIVPVKFSDFPVDPVFQESIQTSCRPTLSLWLPVCFRASSWCRNIRERIFYYMDHICSGNKLSFKVMSNLWGGEQKPLLLVHQLKVKVLVTSSHLYAGTVGFAIMMDSRWNLPSPKYLQWNASQSCCWEPVGAKNNQLFLHWKYLIRILCLEWS
jgi:hypothetical protein